MSRQLSNTQYLNTEK